MTEFYNFEFKDINNFNLIKLKDFAGKLILIVNTASRCGFTKQYAELENLWNLYKDKGLVIIAVPSNDFGKQEQGLNIDIARFCKINFGTSFYMTEKLRVKGPGAHPFFSWSRKKFGWWSGPKWNFYKFMINQRGEPIDWFSSFTSPLSKKITSLIDANINIGIS